MEMEHLCIGLNTKSKEPYRCTASTAGGAPQGPTPLLSSPARWRVWLHAERQAHRGLHAMEHSDAYGMNNLIIIIMDAMPSRL